MKCHDCKKEVGFNREYCPHCSAELFYSKKDRTRLTFPGTLINAEIN